jgi:predicted MPP superfamily phosphohydrolase
VCHGPLRDGKPPGSSGWRRWRRALLAAGAVALGLLLYAWAVEPYWIEVTRHQVAAPLAAPLKVAHLTDLHLYGLGRRERKLLALLDRERPDVIVITGDSVVNGDPFAPAPGLADDPTYARAAPVFARLRAPLGVWAVRGNWENWRRVRDERAWYRRHGIGLLVNEAREVRPGLWIAGLDDIQATPDPDAAARAIPQGAYVLALFHSPAYFDRIAGRFPLALAGHTHGGQARPPLVPVFWLPAGSGRYLAGWYEVNGSRMYVSRGLGTSTLPVRFRCRPELAVITVGPG